MKWTIGRKLALAFGSILTLMVVSAIVNFVQIYRMEKVQGRVIHLRMPTAQAGGRLLNGVNKSLATLRGYMILGSDPAKGQLLQAQRQEAWDQIDQALGQMAQYAKNWTVSANVERLHKVQARFERFRFAQQEIEAIAHTDENIPSYYLLLTEAAPRANSMLKAVTAIIDQESDLPATTDRKHLLKSLADIRGSFAVGLANIRAFLLSGDDRFRAGFQQKWATNEKVHKQVDKQLSLFTPTQRQHWDRYASIRKQFAPLPAQMFELRVAEDWNLANHWLGTKAAPEANAIVQILHELAESQSGLLARDSAQLERSAKMVNVTVIAATFVAFIVGMAVAVVFGRRLVGGLKSLVTRAKRIATGDLTGEPLLIKAQDEMGDLTVAINDMSSALNEVVTEITQSSEEVATASAQIAASSQEMSVGMEEQNNEITQIMAAIEQMSASVTEVARKSSETASSATESGSAAEEGGKVVNETIEHMKSINEAVTSSAKVVTELGRRGTEIGQIIDVINDIADQTNLLALNAAIEAARAGEHGRGFAVVADEVRKLADRTTKATAQVAGSIKAIQMETGEAVQRMNTGTEQMAVGVQRATAAGQSLKQIVSNARDVAGMIQSIAAAAEQQSAASEQVSQSVASISAIANKAEAGSRQSAEAVGGLAQRSSQLQALVGRFVLASDMAGSGAMWSRKPTDPVRILIVDDDPSIVTLLEHHLKEMGQCTGVNSGQQAIDAIRSMHHQKQQYDVVCLDILMPGMDGRQVISHIRAMERAQDIPQKYQSKIVMVSSLDGAQDKLKAFRESCDSYITKPVDKEQLFEVMQSVGIKVG